MRLFVMLLIALCLCLLITPAAGQEGETSPENIFGVVEGFWLPDVVCELNPGWERIIFDWSQHQPTGPDDWHTLNVDDRWLAAAQDCNREVVAIVKHTPDWATDGLAGPGVPLGLYLPVDDPANLWANFMRRAAEYYAPRGVSRFIIWNEPDIDPETYGFEFEGDLEDYYQLLKVSYLAAKQGNPAARIHLAGTTYWHDVNAGRRLYMDRLIERILQDPDAAANGYYFDALSLHIYFRTDTVYDIVRTMRDLLDGYGLRDKAIWINETNAAPTDDPLWPVVRPVYQLDLAQQSAFLVQAAALSLAAGADRVAAYKFYDWNLPPSAEAFGLLRADGSRRPAFDAWAMVIHHMNGVDAAALAQTERLNAVRLDYADGRIGLLAWARTDAAVEIQINATGAEASLIDQYGHIITIHPVDGLYTLSLRAARCNEVDGCAVGGSPWLLVQPGGETAVREQVSGQVVDLTFE